MDSLELHVNQAGLNEQWEIRSVFVQKEFKTAHAIERSIRCDSGSGATVPATLSRRCERVL